HRIDPFVVLVVLRRQRRQAQVECAVLRPPAGNEIAVLPSRHVPTTGRQPIYPVSIGDGGLPCSLPTHADAGQRAGRVGATATEAFALSSRRLFNRSQRRTPAEPDR